MIVIHLQTRFTAVSTTRVGRTCSKNSPLTMALTCMLEAASRVVELCSRLNLRSFISYDILATVKDEVPQG